MYSELVTHVALSPNYGSRGTKIDTITVHHTAGRIGVENLGAIFLDPARQASSNYGIGYDGRIACYVEEENRSWCSSDRENDRRAITIEVSNSDNGPTWAVSDEAWEALVSLCADICRRYGFRLNFTGDTDGNLTMHKWFAATGCPGPWLEPRFPLLAAQVNARLEGAEPAPAAARTPPQLSQGAKGPWVRALQALLEAQGEGVGSAGLDGDLGPATARALEAFQRRAGLDPDRICGPLTWGALVGR